MYCKKSIAYNLLQIIAFLHMQCGIRVLTPNNLITRRTLLVSLSLKSFLIRFCRLL